MNKQGISFRQVTVHHNFYLDILRAVAIVMVVVYHVLLMCPVASPVLMNIAWYGQYGVELFFVLSGWLIGGLYWNEKYRFGDVELRRFWLRRWLRTIPPYLVALALSLLAVYIQGGKAFDLGYLVFIQNYYNQIPYFLISWSLCIEEHFYLFLPVLLVFNPQGDKKTFALFSLLVLVAPICRWRLSLDGVSTVFGYQQTATHLRMEGLLIGFWLAHENLRSPQRWHQMKQGAPWLLLAAAAAFAALQFAPPVWMYRLGLTFLAIALAAMLVCLVDRKASKVGSSRWIKAVAQASFSIYLSHPLMIHAARKLMKNFPIFPWQCYFPIVFCLIAMAGAAFYHGVERSSILLRDRWVP